MQMLEWHDTGSLVICHASSGSQAQAEQMVCPRNSPSWIVSGAATPCLGSARPPCHNITQGHQGVRGGRTVHGASDVSELQACNQCLCGVWVRSQLAALDKLHCIKGIFGAGHVPVVSSGHSGFLHHQNGKVLISLIIGSSEGRFRSRDERKRAENMWNMNEE
jgi:hypothetical protein